MQMHGLRSILDIFTHLFSFCLEKILGAFKKLRKATLASSCLSVRPSVCPHGTVRLPLLGFSRNFLLVYFSKIFRKNSRFTKI
jgi:hypothetical protein